jgi:hypothetical protein
MAISVQMKHKQSGILKNGYYGFSWTTFFFGGFPALFRGDIMYGLAVLVFGVVIGLATFGLGSFVVWLVWACIYNKNYTHRLLQAGFEFDDRPELVGRARHVLNIAAPSF